jgi:hypothetical protein
MIRDRMRFAGVVFMAAAVAMGVAGTVAQSASPGGPTRGDARAVFEASLNAGLAIRAHNPDAHGAPGQLLATEEGVRIDPLADSGRRYCSNGWHVISLALFEQTSSFAGGKKELADLLAASEIRFVLDGRALEVQRTALKPVGFASVEDAFGVNFGAFLPPGSVSLGTHDLQWTVSPPGFEDSTATLSFIVISC